MYRCFSLGLFAMSLGIQTAIYAEIMGFIKTVENAAIKGWFLLGIETDSSVLAQKVRSKSDAVHWSLKTRWRKCLNILYSNPFRITHIFREGNGVADVMANIGFSIRLHKVVWHSSEC